MAFDTFEQQMMREAKRYEPRIIAYLNALPDKADYADAIIKFFFVKSTSTDYHHIARLVTTAIHNLSYEMKIELDSNLKLRIRS